ncbi:hypothetical protein BVY01_02490 [bacterium I07]|nr:hypothetical protein BVY01_02490 [bacterium I07]
MQSKWYSNLTIVAMTILFCGLIFAQSMKTTIEEIMDNPGRFESESVEIEGVVDQWIKGSTTTTSHYLLKGNYGGIIKVTTLQEPKIGPRFKVTGICFIEAASRTPFISEQNRTELDQPTENTVIIEKEKSNSGLFIALILLLVGLLAFLVYYQTKMKKAQPSTHAPTTFGEPVSKQGPGEGPPETVKIRKDFSTVKIHTAPKTMKLIPGELTIISGDDKGKSFKIAGYPTPEGSVVTIGSEDVTGDRAFAHIKLFDPQRTVSRKQAHIIDRDRKLYIKNISKVNFTEVNGKVLGPEEEIELTPDAHIRMGYLELKYTR